MTDKPQNIQGPTPDEIDQLDIELIQEIPVSDSDLLEWVAIEMGKADRAQLEED